MSGYSLRAVLGALLLAGAARSLAAQAADSTPVLSAMQQELARSMRTLGAQPTPPYFLSYAITEQRSAAVRGAYGTITSTGEERGRLLDLDIRVGSPMLDNTHATRDGMPPGGMFAGFETVQVPVDDDPIAIRRVLWRATDRRYKEAVEQYLLVRTDAQLHAAPDDTSPDFSREPAARFTEAPEAIAFDSAAWARKVRAYTAPFARYGDIYDAAAELSVEGGTRWYVNSDGAALRTSSAYYRLFISAYTRAGDGTELPRYESFVATSPAGLPDDSTVLAAVARMIVDLHALKKAPVLGAVTVPAILSGRASGVFFHEVFGHRIEGHRQKEEDDAQTFVGKVGEQVLPRGFSVYSDPTQRRLGHTDLAGYYLYDDEGVRARRVDVVTNGTFRNFLMSRSPIAGFPHSNGHGRSEPGFAPVARQSNLVVTTAHPVSRAELKRRLLAEIRRQHKPFGLYFDDIEGGFTITTREEPNAFEVIPVMVYRVFPDGREELVRGVDLIGTPLTVFSRIVAADDDVQVFNGVCGAESGNVPVSAASPDILISQVEVQRKEKSQEQAPILAAPQEAHP